MTFRSGLIAGLVFFAVAVVGVAKFHQIREGIAGCRGVPLADQNQYAAAMELSARANGAISSGNYSTASDILDMAISRLGHAYESAASSDDTDMILQAGKDKASHFDFKLAVQMKQSVVQTRLSLFRRKMHIWARCHSLLRKIGLG